MTTITVKGQGCFQPIKNDIGLPPPVVLDLGVLGLPVVPVMVRPVSVGAVEALGSEILGSYIIFIRSIFSAQLSPLADLLFKKRVFDSQALVA